MIRNFQWYAENVLRIQTKLQGVRPFKFRRVQRRFNALINEDEKNGQPIRSISLKARQVGWTTFIGGKVTSLCQTGSDFKAMAMADKGDRTREISDIYHRYVENTPKMFRPMLLHKSSKEIVFDNPNEKLRENNPGLRSSIRFETGRDPNAGRGGTRRAVHLSEYAFYWYPSQILDSVENSVPLAPGTYIFKETTANGMTGDGECFYLEWLAAVEKQTIYRPFFVPWFEVDDYILPTLAGFRRTKDEEELCRMCPSITDMNLAWRRGKLLSMANTSATIFTPQERFWQEFPSTPEEAFLHSGKPIFNNDKLKRQIEALRSGPRVELEFTSTMPLLTRFLDGFRLYEAPRENMLYVIGADIAEGVEGGDFSSLYILSRDMKHVGRWHGHIDADIFGKLLVELARKFNNALLVPEINNMGHTTLTAIKNLEYLNVYMRSEYDEVANRMTKKMGWRTTSKNKMAMLTNFVAIHRDDQLEIKDIELLRQMQRVVREPDGNADLGGKDRVVAACLAHMGHQHLYFDVDVTYVGDEDVPEKVFFERRDESRKKIVGDK